MFVNIALFVLLFLYLTFLPFSLSIRLVCTLFGLSAIAYANQKLINARREHAKILRQRMRTIMFLGPLAQNFIYNLLMCSVVFWVIVYNMFAEILTGDVEQVSIFDDPEGALESVKRFCYGEGQSICYTVFFVAEVAYVVVHMATPWILCYDYSEKNPLNIHFNNNDKKYKIKISIAYGIAGTIGIAVEQCLALSMVDISLPIILPNVMPMHVGNATAIWTFVIYMERDLRYIFQILACQLLFSIAAAEQNVLGKKRTMSIAVLLSAAICLARSADTYFFFTAGFSDAIFRFSSNAWTAFTISVAFSKYKRLLNAANHVE